MSRRKQSRPVKVLDDGSEEECTGGDGVSPRPDEPGAAIVVNGHHVSTSTRRQRFDDRKSTYSNVRPFFFSTFYLLFFTNPLTHTHTHTPILVYVCTYECDPGRLFVTVLDISCTSSKKYKTNRFVFRFLLLVFRSS